MGHWSLWLSSTLWGLSHFVLRASGQMFSSTMPAHDYGIMVLSIQPCVVPPGHLNLIWRFSLFFNTLYFLQVFLEVVPRFLCMPPLVDESEATTEVNGIRERRRSSFGLMQRAEEYVLKQPRSEMMFDKQRERHGLTQSIGSSSLLWSPSSFCVFPHCNMFGFFVVVIVSVPPSG